MKSDILKADRLEQLYQEHRQMMFHVAMTYLRDNDLAMDIVHDSFISLWEKYELIDFTDEKKLRGLIGHIVKGKAIDLIRKRNREMPDELQEELLGHREDKYFENDEVERILGHLDDSSAELIRMRFIMDLPYDVIASKLRIKETAARKRVNRAKNKLQQVYEEIEHDKT